MLQSPLFQNSSPKQQTSQPYQKQKYTVNCQGNINTFKTYELIRFQFGTNHWFDPYHNYFEIEVEMDKTNFGVYDMLCLDGPSTALISELIISINSVEIERVYEHDQIGKFLSDFHVKPKTKKYKLNEGYMYDCIQYSLHGVSNKLRTVNATTQTDNGYGFESIDSYQYQAASVTNSNTSLGINVYNQNQGYKHYSHMGVNKNLFVQGANSSVIAPAFKYGQYLAMHDHTMGIQSSESSQGMYNYKTGSIASNVTRDSTNNFLNNGGMRRPYSAFIEPDKYFFFMKGNTDYIQNGFYPLDFRRNTTQDFSNGAGFMHMDYLNYEANVNSSITRKTLIIPLLSSFMGHLLPNDQHRLMPGSFFGNIQIEIRMNRYAFYTSGLKNGGVLKGQSQTIVDAFGGSAGARPNAEFTLNANQQILPRNWTFKKVDFVMQLYQFKQQDEQMLLQQYSNGILLNSQFYFLAHQQTFANTALLEQNIQINQKHKSVKAVWWWYLLNDYENRPYCRKSFRISGNLTGLQAEFGNTFYPYHEVKGKSGNFLENDKNDLTNQNMYMYFQESLGALFNSEIDLPYNQINYAINERCWDVTVFDKQYNTWTQVDVMNYANGNSVYNEQRQGVGGGVYCIPFELIPQQGYSGLNLNNSNEPLILRIKADKQNYNNSQTTMYVFFHIDVEYRIMPNGNISVDK